MNKKSGITENDRIGNSMVPLLHKNNKHTGKKNFRINPQLFRTLENSKKHTTPKSLMKEGASALY